MPSPVGHSTGFNYGVRFAIYHGLRLVLPGPVGRQPRRRTGPGGGMLVLTLAGDDLPQRPGRPGRRRCRHSDSSDAEGAPAPAALVDAATDLGIGVLAGLYGSTGGPRGHVEPPRRPGRSAAGHGRPAAGTRRQRRGAGRVGADLPAGRDHARSSPEVPTLASGFFGDVQRTASTFSDGWVQSGDLGRHGRRGMAHGGRAARRRSSSEAG